MFLELHVTIHVLESGFLISKCNYMAYALYVFYVIMHYIVYSIYYSLNFSYLIQVRSWKIMVSRYGGVVLTVIHNL